MKLRSYLVLLTLATLIPLAAFAIAVGVVLVERDRDTFRRGAQERTLAILTAVDAEVQGSVTTALALAAAPELQRGDLRRLRSLAARILETQRNWSTIHVATPGGQQLMNLLRPPGAPLPNIADVDGSLSRVLQTLQPAVGDVVMGPVTKAWDVAVRVPVVREGQLWYVLSAIMQPAVIAEVLKKQELPAGWSALVLDRNGRTVARTIAPQASVGQLASQPMRDALARAPAGWFLGRTIDGVDVYTPYHRSQVTGWTVAMGIPVGAVQAGLRRVAWIFAAGLLGATALALALAFLLSRYIAAPIINLAAVSSAGGVPPVKTGVAEIRALAAALQHRDALIEREKNALRSADRAKDEVLATLSHELRNPLAALTAASSVLERVQPDSEAGEQARSIVRRQTENMARLIDDLLEVSRVAMGKVELVRTRFDLGTAVSELAESWRNARRFERHVVELDTTAAWVEADRSRVEQIVGNLLDNALKFSPAGKRIGLSVRQQGSEVVLRVADEGDGIPPPMLDAIFGLFVQGDQGLARSRGGMGVGLALVRRLAELHGGSASASSEGPGEGAVFEVRLPSAAPEAEPRPASQPVRARGAAPRCVLLVEDNDDARLMMAAVLTLAGHDVKQANSAMLGLALAMQWRCDLALIDIGLPDLDGYEVARRLRANEATRDISLIALTGYGQAEDRRRALEAGFDAHLTKPVSADRLEEAVATVGLRLSL